MILCIHVNSIRASHEYPQSMFSLITRYDRRKYKIILPLNVLPVIFSSCHFSLSCILISQDRQFYKEHTVTPYSKICFNASRA